MEAKKTENRTRYRLDPWDREKHQREFLARWNGIKCYLIAFWTVREYFVVPFQVYQEWHEKARAGGRQSIPIQWLRDNVPRAREGQRVALDFLAAVDECGALCR